MKNPSVLVKILISYNVVTGAHIVNEILIYFGKSNICISITHVFTSAAQHFYKNIMLIRTNLERMLLNQGRNSLLDSNSKSEDKCCFLYKLPIIPYLSFS